VTTTHNDPEEAIAYDEAYMREQFERSGLSIVDDIHYGSWAPIGHAREFKLPELCDCLFYHVILLLYC